MNKLTQNKMLLTFGLTLGMFASVNASAQEVSLERALSAAIVAQSQQLASQVSNELKSNISAGIDNFSISVAKNLIVKQDEKKNVIARQATNAKRPMLTESTKTEEE